MTAGTEIAQLYATIGADTNPFTRALDGVKGALGGIGGMVAVTGAALAGIFTASVISAANAQMGIAQLNAVLKSTGGVAGVSADMATELAASFQGLTRYSDEAVLSAENILLTFTNIGKDTFPQATSTVLDMSTALGIDLKEASIMVGKALQDPAGQVANLRRVGVNFTTAQVSMIKSLVATGQQGKATALILKELQTEFGGSAQAAGQTFAGRLDQLRNSFDDILETIGNAFLPALTAITQGFGDLVRTAGAFIPQLLASLQNINVGEVFHNILSSLGLDRSAIAEVEAFFSNLGNTITTLWEALKQTIAGFIGTGAEEAAAPLSIADLIGADKASQVEAVSSVDAQYKDTLDAIMAGLRTSVDEFKGHPVLQELKDALNAPLNAAREMTTESRGVNDSPILEAIKNALGITPDVEAKISGILGGIRDTVGPLLKDIGDGITGFIQNLQGADFSGFQKITDFMIKFNLSVLGFALTGAGLILKGIASALPDVGKGIKDFANAVTAFTKGDFLGAFQGIIKFLQDLNSALQTEAVTILTGIVQSIRDMLGIKGDFSVLATFKDWVDRLYGAFKALADAISAVVGAARGAGGGPIGEAAGMAAAAGASPEDPRYNPFVSSSNFGGYDPTTSKASKDSGGLIAGGRAYQSNVAEVFFPPGSMAVPLANMATGGGNQNVTVNLYAYGASDPHALVNMVDAELDRRNLPKIGRKA